MSVNANHVSTYFSTKQAQFDTKGNQTTGIWSISHSSVFDPFYMGRDYLKKATGMTWIEIRSVLKEILLWNGVDPLIIKDLKRKLNPLIPVRSGKLMDTIFRTMTISRKSWYSSHYWIDLDYSYPRDRPRVIKNPAHTPPAKGYGEWGTVKLLTPEAKARVKIDHVTAGGNALYELNDPGAVASVETTVNKYAEDELLDDTANRFNITIEVIF